MHLNIHTSKTSIKIYNLNCKSFSPTTATTTAQDDAGSRLCDVNSYYAYHTNFLSYTEAEPEQEPEPESEKQEEHTKKQYGNDIINTYSASASISNSLSLGSVKERSSQGNPTTATAADDNNCALRISSCKPLKFPLASEWLV